MTIKVLSKRLLLIFLVCSTGIFSLASQTDEIEVWAITWSPNDNILAIGQSDGLVKIIDAQTNTLVNTLDIAGPDAGIIRLAWSPDGTRIASSTYDGGLYVWRVSDSDLIFELPDVSGSNDQVRSLDWNNDSNRLAGVIMAGGWTYVWDVSAESLIVSKRSGGDFEKTAVRWLDNDRIATTFANGINIFDANFVLDFDIVHHSTYILDMEFHEQLALSGEQNGTTIVSNLVTGELISTIPDPSNGIIALNWHPSGDFVVTTNWDGELKVWDIRQNSLVCSLHVDGYVLDAEWDTTGDWLAYGGTFDSDVVVIPNPVESTCAATVPANDSG